MGDPIRKTPAQRQLTTMHSLAEQGLSIIVVTHGSGFAREVADRVQAMIDDGLVERFP